MNMSKNIQSKLLIKLLFIVAFTFFTSRANAQNFVSGLSTGFSGKYDCMGMDSIGNLYVVTGRNTSDTVYFKKWNPGSRSWSVFTFLKGFVVLDYKTSSCSFLNGKLYYTGIENNTFKTVLMEYSGTWKKIATFSYPYVSFPLITIKFKNKLYFSGSFDSINRVYMPCLAAYDGDSFRSQGFPLSYVGNGLNKPSMLIVGDSLYLTIRNKIILHSGNSNWQVLYTNPAANWINNIEFNNNLFYSASSNQIKILKKDGTKIDSFSVPNAEQINMKTFKNKLYIASKNFNTTVPIYVIKDLNYLKFIFNNQMIDTNNISFISNVNNLYYLASNGVVVKGVDYNGIVRINTDTISTLGYDTIVGMVYWDKNGNNIKDGNDATPKSGGVQNLTDNYQIEINTSDGIFRDIVFDNSNYEYKMNFVSYDSCVQTQFSGTVKSSNTIAGKTKDTIQFLSGRSSYKNINLVLKNLSNYQARIADTIPLLIGVRSDDCYNGNTNNGTVFVTLDSNTVLQSAVPNYTSKNGNIYTFNNLTFDYTKDNLIKLKVIYPFSKYSLGSIIKHHVSLGAIANEDPANNSDSILQRMVYSYDPNAKYSIPTGKITKELKAIRYYIDFQNEGNDVARKVTVIDTLNLKMPIYEFHMVTASHPYTVSITPGTSVVSWVFDNINLEAISKNEKASKGYLVFEAKVRGDLRVGDSITNKASIYFDYNSPIVTNYAVIQRVDEGKDTNSGVNGIVASYGALKIYPNPAQHYFKIENNKKVTQSIAIYNAVGLLIMQFNLNEVELKTIDTSSWAKGLYLIVESTGKSGKLVIE